ncbi:MAG: GGDEF domain-containing protein [Streptosporangiaceae bacterium]
MQAAELARWPVCSLPEPLRAFLAGVDVLAASLTVLAILAMPWRLAEMLSFAGLLACGVIVIEATRSLREIHGAVNRDLQSVWYLAMAITLPPGYVMLAPLPVLAYRLCRMRTGVLYKRAFSNATLSLAYGSASVTFRLIPRGVVGPAPGSNGHVLVWTAAVTGCALIGWVINYGLLLVAIRMSDPTTRVRDLFGTRDACMADLLEISLAVSLTLVVAINPVLMTLALPSVILCRRYLMRAQQVAQVRIDAGTGLLNPCTWQREAEFEFFRALRTCTPLAVAMVDIDDFRSVQETAGAEVAVQLRRDVATMLAEQLREQDLIGILGGQEFAILFPGTSMSDARRISERMRDRIAGESIAIESGSQAGFVFRLTVSIGVAVMNESRRALMELIGAADSALDQARGAGWSKVCIAAEPPDDPGDLVVDLSWARVYATALRCCRLRAYRGLRGRRRIGGPGHLRRCQAGLHAAPGDLGPPG